MMVLGVIGFAAAMTMRDYEASVFARGLLAAAGAGFLSSVYGSRPGMYPSTSTHRATMVLGAIGFAVAMAARDQLSSIHARALLGGLAGGFIALGVSAAYQRPARK